MIINRSVGDRIPKDTLSSDLGIDAPLALSQFTSFH